MVLALLPSLAQSEAVVLIAHPELVELGEADVGLLRQLFLARRSRVGGRRIHCFEPAPGSPARRAFARSVIERSERELESYWLEQALSGGPPPPREIASDAALVERVATRRGALAYLGWESLRGLGPAKVRIVPIRHEGRLLGPEDPAYPLQMPAPTAPQATPPAGRKTGE